MKIRNIEVDFDFLDADDIERFENEVKTYMDKCDEESKKEYTASESLRVQCKIIEDFVDGVFEKGLSDKIFKKKANLREHLDIFEEIIKEKQKYDEIQKNKYERYQHNRYERRNQFKKGRK